MNRSLIKIVSLLGLLIIASANAAINEEFRGITHVTGDLYQVQDDNNTYTAFLVTPEGIILVDPINTRTAVWLKAELKKRFDLPVKYLIYSHSHDDHSSGAAVYDEATIVGHERSSGSSTSGTTCRSRSMTSMASRVMWTNSPNSGRTTGRVPRHHF